MDGNKRLELLKLEVEIKSKIVDWSVLVTTFDLPAATDFNKLQIHQKVQSLL